MLQRVTRKRHLAILRSQSSNEVADTASQENPCKASSVIRHLDEVDGKNLLVVVYMRASTWEQRKRRNLKNRIRGLRRELRQRGIRWVKSYREVVSGTSLHGRPKLVEAIDIARRVQSGNPHAVVAVVTDARNRFIRGRHFNGQADTDLPSARQLEKLKKLAGSVTLATVLHPDAPFDEVRSHEVKVAQKAGKKVGRPPKQATEQREPGWTKTRRKEMLPEACRLKAAGMSKRGIAKHLRVSDGTIRNWLKQHRI